MWERRYSVGASAAEMRLQKRTCFGGDLNGERISIYSGPTVCQVHLHPWPPLEPC